MRLCYAYQTTIVRRMQKPNSEVVQFTTDNDVAWVEPGQMNTQEKMRFLREGYKFSIRPGSGRQLLTKDYEEPKPGRYFAVRARAADRSMAGSSTTIEGCR
jgi:hypothetical protein